MNRLAEIETFVAVVEAGSLSAASRRLDTAVSAVSRRIGDLESRLGVRLANRSTRGFSITPLGQDYYEKCLRLLADFDEMDSDATGERSRLSGLVRIAVPLSFGVKQLSPVLNRFAIERPQMRFEVDLSDRRVHIIDEGFDLAIRIGALPDSSLVARSLFKVKLLVVAAPSYWDIHGRPQRPEDLVGLPAVTYRLTANPSTWEFLRKDGSRGQVRLPSRYSVSNGDFGVKAAVDGLGVALHPSFICAAEILDGRLESVLDDTKWNPINAYVVWPSGRPLPLRVRQLVDYLVESFTDPPAWDIELSNK